MERWPMPPWVGQNCWPEVGQINWPLTIAVRPDRSDRKALPKGQKRINIVHKNAGLWMCLVALTSSLKLAFLFLSFPGFREEPFLLIVKLKNLQKRKNCSLFVFAEPDKRKKYEFR